MNANSNRVERKGIGHSARHCNGFSLMELLTVVAIISMLTVVSGPAIQSLNASGNVNRAMTEIFGTLETARAYAMANHTYVRVALGGVAASQDSPNVRLIVLSIYSRDGTLDADGSSDMASATKWPAVVRPVVMDNLNTDDTLGATGLAANDTVPSKSNIAAFSRTVGNCSSVRFTSFVQFNPAGEASVVKGELPSYIRIGVDRPSPRNGKNPFVLRLSGVNGTISILRKGEGL